MNNPIFNFWETVSDLASAFDVPYPTAQSWTHRGFIPASRDEKRIQKIEELTSKRLDDVEKFALIMGFMAERKLADEKAKGAAA